MWSLCLLISSASMTSIFICRSTVRGAEPSVVIDCLEQGALRQLLAAVVGLSESSTGLVVDMAERLRRAEKLPEITAGAD